MPNVIRRNAPRFSVLDYRRFEFLLELGRPIISGFNDTWNLVSKGSLLLARPRHTVLTWIREIYLRTSKFPILAAGEGASQAQRRRAHN